NTPNAVGSKQEVGILLAGNMFEYNAPAAGAVPPAAVIAAVQPGRLFKMEAKFASVPPANGVKLGSPGIMPLEKSPPTSAVLGRTTVPDEIPCTSRFPS